MIEIGSTSGEVSPDLLASPGGFVWWYVDLVAPGGDGAVLIWSYGLPFLPGYAGAARRGAPQTPAARPSVNLAVYRRGVPSFYLLQEYPSAGADVVSGLSSEQRIGRCVFRRSLDKLRCTVDAEIDCELPGGAGRVTGTVRVEGAARSAEADAAQGDPPHVWTPLTGPATGELSLSIDGGEAIRIAGRAYHDRNWGRVPLHALGIDRWMWGRFPFEDREAVYYLLWPSGGGAPIHLGIEIGADGATRRMDLDVTLGRGRRAFGGLMRPERISMRAGGRAWLDVVHTHTVDAGPFYLRMLSEGRDSAGRAVTGWSELCVPDRVDLPIHRPFVRMRVHRTAGPNSPWLPLFTGPRAGRAARLLKTFLPLGR